MLLIPLNVLRCLKLQVTYIPQGKDAKALNVCHQSLACGTSDTVDNTVFWQHQSVFKDL